MTPGAFTPTIPALPHLYHTDAVTGFHWHSAPITSPVIPLPALCSCNYGQVIYTAERFGGGNVMEFTTRNGGTVRVVGYDFTSGGTGPGGKPNSRLVSTVGPLTAPRVRVLASVMPYQVHLTCGLYPVVWTGCRLAGV